MRDQLAAIKSSMAETISSVGQWDSGSERCYNQLMKALSETMSVDHRPLLYKRDESSHQSQEILRHLEKLIRVDMFGPEPLPHGMAFMSKRTCRTFV